MAKNIDPEALQRLINATQEYIDSVSYAENTLGETLETCGLVMKNDRIFKKQRPKMENALEELRNAKVTAARMKEQLEIKWNELNRFQQEL